VCGNCATVGSLSLKGYRTATTLCVPDLVFNDISRHKILLPEGTPVQREILTGLSAYAAEQFHVNSRSVYKAYDTSESFMQKSLVQVTFARKLPDDTLAS